MQQAIDECAYVQRPAKNGLSGDERHVGPGVRVFSGSISRMLLDVDVIGRVVHGHGVDELLCGRLSGTIGPNHNLVGDALPRRMHVGNSPHTENHVVNSARPQVDVELSAHTLCSSAEWKSGIGASRWIPRL